MTDRRNSLYNELFLARSDAAEMRLMLEQKIRDVEDHRNSLYNELFLARSDA